MLKIGQSIKWKIGKMHMQGCVLNDDNSGKIEVISHFRNGMSHIQKMNVEKSIIETT